jgi:hypothetical protein
MDDDTCNTTGSDIVCALVTIAQINSEFRPYYTVGGADSTNLNDTLIPGNNTFQINALAWLIITLVEL